MSVEALRLRLKERAKNDRPRERVDFAGIPGWEDERDVFVRMLSVGERDSFDNSLTRIDSQGEVEAIREDHDAKLVILAACTAEGEPIYRQEDLDWLRQGGHLACRRMYEAAAKVSRMGYAEKNPEGRPPAAAESVPAGACPGDS